jgi:hypothetical protein
LQVRPGVYDDTTGAGVGVVCLANGTDPVEVEPYKWRSQNGKWQYRAKPDDVAQGHIHLEEIDPSTGEVKQNVHLRWPEGTGR